MKSPILFVALLAKLLGFVIWIITFIDFYALVPVGLRYFLCLFPNAGLLFCIQVLQQYERRSGQFIGSESIVSRLIFFSRWYGYVSTTVFQYFRLSIVHWCLSTSDVNLFGDLSITGCLCRTVKSRRIRCF